MGDAAPNKTKEALEILRKRDAALEEARAADPHTALTPVAASSHAKDHEDQRTAAVALNLPTVAEGKATANKVPQAEKKIGKKKDAAKAPEVVFVRKRRTSGGSSSSNVPPPEGLSPNTMLAVAEAKGRTKAKTAVKVPEPEVEEVPTNHNEAKPASKVTTESKVTKESDPVDYDSDTPPGSLAELEGLGDLGDPAV
jgi:hypothetical protein